MLTTILTLALGAFGLTAVLRALAPLELLLRKPLSCDLCMAFWTATLFSSLQLLLAIVHRELVLSNGTLLAWALHFAGPVIGTAYLLNLAGAWLRDTRGTAPVPMVDNGDSTDTQEPL